MRIGSKSLWILAGLTLTCSSLAAQTPGREKLQTEIDSLSASLQNLHHRQQTLSKQADSLAQDIQRRKQKAPSFLQDRALNTALRFSQTMADSLQTLQAQEHRLDRLLRQKAEQLLEILNGDIDRLVEEAEKQKRIKNKMRREQVTRELLQYREWQRRCQELLEQPPPSIIIYEVHVQPQDSEETRRRKADFLRDQADRLQRDVKRLEAKIAEIRTQTEVNERVADLVRDMSLFDPSGESVSSASANLTRDTAPAEAGPDLTTERSKYQSALAGQTSQLPAVQNWPTNVSDLSIDELKRWQSILEHEKRHRLSQADSLRQRAEEVERIRR
jgi:hypothetical protein